MFSFYSDDSFEPIQVQDPQLEDRQVLKPKTVPQLNLVGLPDYESSSEEEDEGAAECSVGQLNIRKGHQQMTES